KDTATSVAAQIVKGNLSAVIGHFNSGTAIPASSVYEAAKIPNLSTSATNPLLTGRGYRYTFRASADDLSLSGDLMRYLNIKDMNDFLFAVHDETAYGENVVSGAMKQVLLDYPKKKFHVIHGANVEDLDISGSV